MSLFMKMIRKSERVYVDHRAMQFDYLVDGERQVNHGFSFDLNQDNDFFVEDWNTGEITVGFEALALAAQENLLWCCDEANKDEIMYVGIVEWQHTYWQHAIGECSCGAEVHLSDPMDNVCDGCGTIFNMSGQRMRCLARDVDYLDAGERYDDEY